MQQPTAEDIAGALHQRSNELRDPVMAMARAVQFDRALRAVLNELEERVVDGALLVERDRETGVVTAALRFLVLTP